VLWIIGELEVVDPPRRLVYSWSIASKEATPPERSRVTVRFEARDGGTEVIVVHERIDTEATRAEHEKGWIGCLDGLEAMFASLRER
jgi:uncharacterized protein YndB with AHSA1/START domain